jgi:integrase
LVDAAFEKALVMNPPPYEPSPWASRLLARLMVGTTAAEMAAELEESFRTTMKRASYLEERRVINEQIQSAIERDRAAQKARDAARAMVFVAETSPLLRAGETAEFSAAPVKGEHVSESTSKTCALSPTSVPSAETAAEDSAKKMEDAPSTVATKRRELRPASSFVEAFFEYRAEIEGCAHHPMLQDRGTINGFIEVCGDKPFRRYHRGDVTRYLNLIRRLPPYYRKSKIDKRRTLAEIADAAEQQGVEGRLKESTIQRHHSALTQFFRYAADQGEITIGQKGELFDERRFADKDAPRHRRGVMTADEHKTLFSSPTWARADVRRDAKFWVPLLLRYQGARLEEMADLVGEDIVCIEGIWCIDINAKLRRLKNTNAERRIPLHPEILACGFVEYANAIASKPGDPLFPDLKPRKGDGKRGDYLVDWFAQLRRKLRIFRLGVSLHSFRHDVNTRLRDTTMGQDVGALRCIRYILGHAGGTVEEQREQDGVGEKEYDRGPPKADLLAVLSKLSYPGDDLSHLHGWRPRRP